MNQSIDSAYLRAHCVGLDVYRVKNRILRLLPTLGERDIQITYRNTGNEKFCVLDCAYDAQRQTVHLVVESPNPMRHMPSNYQENSFLENYLMIFQHIMNRTSITLDNLHNYLRPMECPAHFLPVLADWFGIRLDTLGGEDEVRRFLQYAIPLYRYRGTKVGLRAHLAIVAGIVPEIIEGEIPYTAMRIMDGADVESNFFDADVDESFFTVFFPVLRSSMDDALVNRLSLILQDEKPVHTRCFLYFLKPETRRRQVTTIVQDTFIDPNAGISM